MKWKNSNVYEIDSNKLISGRMVKVGLLRENCPFLF